MKKLLVLITIMILATACDHGWQTVGPSGSVGANGSNGLSLVTTFLQATPTQCSNGGTVVLIAKDNAGTGLWNINDIVENSFVVCNGLNGAQGPVGSTGSVGPQGPAGTNATPLTIVQFCPNKTTYPGTFSEVGFCYQGNIYAVYSANSGFMTEIMPGNYSSDGINSSCTFTVSANCVISH